MQDIADAAVQRVAVDNAGNPETLHTIFENLVASGEYYDFTGRPATSNFSDRGHDIIFATQARRIDKQDVWSCVHKQAICIDKRASIGQEPNICPITQQESQSVSHERIIGNANDPSRIG